MSQDIATVLKAHDYELIRYLGKGAFASCYLVKSLKYKMEFVCKCSLPDKASQKYIISFINEADILSQLNHPNIVRIYDYFLENGQIFMILEYCPNGNLLDLIRIQEKLDKQKIIKYATELIDALSYIHSFNIAHCDIKLSNILIDAYDRIKICDFGLSHLITDQFDIGTRFAGTLHYMAPEVIMGLKFCPFKADVWSIGITLYILITNCLPFRGKDPRGLLQDMRAGYIKIPNCGQLSLIVDQCLNMDPEQRPTMQQLKFKIMEVSDRSLKNRSCNKIVVPMITNHQKNHPSRLSKTSISCVY